MKCQNLFSGKSKYFKMTCEILHSMLSVKNLQVLGGCTV